MSFLITTIYIIFKYFYGDESTHLIADASCKMLIDNYIEIKS